MYRLAILAISLLMLFSAYTKGQTSSDQITWECILKRKSSNEGEIFMKAKIPAGWHLYALGNNPDSPIRMNFKFTADKAYELIGAVSQPKPLRKLEKQLGIPVVYFEDEVTFGQKIKIKGKNGVVKGTIQFMQCNDEICVPPQDFGFALKLRP